MLLFQKTIIVPASAAYYGVDATPMRQLSCESEERAITDSE